MVDERLLSDKRSWTSEELPKKVEKVLAEATEEKEAVMTEVYEYKQGEFKGDTPITREEMASILSEMIYEVGEKLSEPEIDEENPWQSASEKVNFTDYNEIEYDHEVIICTMYGLLTGMGDGTFAPKGTLTRAQAAAIVNRLANLLK